MSKTMSMLAHIKSHRSRRLCLTWLLVGGVCVWSGYALGQSPDKDPKNEQNATSAATKEAESKSKSSDLEPAKKTPTYGTLSITIPDGYAVTVDGRYVGQSPLAGPWAVSVGRHVVALSQSGQPSGEVVVEVKAGELAQVVWPPKTRAVDESDSDEGGWRFPVWTKADAGFAAAIAGLVVVGVGVSFGMRSQDLADEAADMNIRDTYRADFIRLTEQSENASLAANLSYGIGAAALIGGLTVAIFGDGGLITVIGDDDEGAVIIEGEF